MEFGDSVHQKYPTRDCGDQIDEGDFYQILQERADDETLTDSTDKLLHAARNYIYQESANVWRNAEVALLGPDDQLLFKSGTQVNKFVVTFDDRNKVRVYCRERSWNSVRHDAKQPVKAGLGWRSLVNRFRSEKRDLTRIGDSLRMDIIQPVQANPLNNQIHRPGNVSTKVDTTDAKEEKRYSTEEYQITPNTNRTLKTTPKHPTIEEKVLSMKKSLKKNNMVFSLSSILIGLLHVVRLFIVIYWQIIKSAFKCIQSR